MDRVLLILQFSLMLLTASAGVVFALAEGGPIPAITVPVAIAAFVLVDRTKLLRLSPFAVNVVGLGAFVLAGLEFFGEAIEARLLAGGHLLVYLTWAFLLQEKGARQVWWLCGLSVLQIAVASLLTYQSWFGVAMPAFLLLSMWTLSVFQLATAAQRIAAEPAATVSSRTLPVVSTPDAFFGRGSVAVGSTHLEASDRWISRRFVISTVAGTCLATGLAGAFFLFVPRVWQRNAPLLYIDGRPIGGAPNRTGFTETITLGQVGQIQESSRIALTAEFRDLATGRPLSPAEWSQESGGPIRFRGVAQEVYEDGTWRRRRPFFGDGERVRSGRRTMRREGNSPYSVSVQMFLQEAGDDHVLFSTGRAVWLADIKPEQEVVVERWGGVLEARSGDVIRRSLDYTLGVSLEVPSAFVVDPGRSTRDNIRNNQEYLFAASELSVDLRRRLDEWKQRHGPFAAGARPESRYELVRLWETYFANDPEFGYSLTMTVQDHALDPVVDFLVNVRRGHCEYFASALAIMLRSEGIPARVVSGYQGGQQNASTGQWEVRDLHAHAWVEACVDDAPPDPLTGQVGPRWITLDPTPPARDLIVAAQQQQAESYWARFKAGWNSSWSTAIRMNQGDQYSLVYAPLRSRAISTWDSIRAEFSGRVPQFRRLLASPRNWFSWQGGVASFVLLLVLSGLVWSGRRWWNRFHARSAAAGAAESAGIMVPFYRRLEAVLGRAGLSRRPSQTPREFAAGASAALPDLHEPELIRLPGDVTERFYAVRYGGKPLEPGVSDELEERLAQLEQALS